MEREEGKMETERHFLPLQCISLSSFPLPHFLSFPINIQHFSRVLQKSQHTHYEEKILKQNSLLGNLTTCVCLFKTIQISAYERKQCQQLWVTCDLSATNFSKGWFDFTLGSNLQSWNSLPTCSIWFSSCDNGLSSADPTQVRFIWISWLIDTMFL